MLKAKTVLQIVPKNIFKLSFKRNYVFISGILMKFNKGLISSFLFASLISANLFTATALFDDRSVWDGYIEANETFEQIKGKTPVQKLPKGISDLYKEEYKDAAFRVRENSSMTANKNGDF